MKLASSSTSLFVLSNSIAKYHILIWSIIPAERQHDIRNVACVAVAVLQLLAVQCAGELRKAFRRFWACVASCSWVVCGRTCEYLSTVKLLWDLGLPGTTTPFLRTVWWARSVTAWWQSRAHLYLQVSSGGVTLHFVQLVSCAQGWSVTVLRWFI